MNLFKVIVMFFIFFSCSSKQESYQETHDSTLVEDTTYEEYYEHYEPIVLQPNTPEVLVDDPQPETYELDSTYFYYEVPSEMYVKQSYQITTKFTKSNEILQDLHNELESNDSEKIKGIDSIETSRSVKVELIDARNAFVIEPFQESEFYLVNDRKTVWRWEVEPVKAGTYTLTIRVTTKVYDGISDSLYPLDPPYEKEIQVKTTASVAIVAFLSNNWQWLITALVIPLVVFLYQKFKK